MRNAEYRLCLERNLGIHEEFSEKQEAEKADYDGNGTFPDRTTAMFKLQGDDLSAKSREIVEEPHFNELDIQGLGEMTPKIQQYIIHLQSRLSSVKKVRTGV